MYVYKALVHCLPASNKLKLVQLVNQNSNTPIDVIQLSYYDFGVVAQANGVYVGVTLVHVEPGDHGRHFKVHHCCVSEKHRGRGNARDMLQIVNDDITRHDNISMTLPVEDLEWKGDFLERTGWTHIKTTMTEMVWEYSHDHRDAL